MNASYDDVLTAERRFTFLCSSRSCGRAKICFPHFLLQPRHLLCLAQRLMLSRATPRLLLVRRASFSKGKNDGKKVFTSSVKIAIQFDKSIALTGDGCNRTRATGNKQNMEKYFTAHADTVAAHRPFESESEQKFFILEGPSIVNKLNWPIKRILSGRNS